jgi:hypothetical protein
MFPVTRLGTFAELKRVPRHADVVAVVEQHGLLVGIMREQKTFHDQMFAVSQDKPRRAANHSLATMFRAQHDRGIGGAPNSFDADRTAGLVAAVGHLDHCAWAGLLDLFAKRLERINGMNRGRATQPQYSKTRTAEAFHGRLAPTRELLI